MVWIDLNLFRSQMPPWVVGNGSSIRSHFFARSEANPGDDGILAGTKDVGFDADQSLQICASKEARIRSKEARLGSGGLF